MLSWPRASSGLGFGGLWGDSRLAPLLRRWIVEQDRNAIARELNVRFENLRALAKGRIERQQRVLGAIAGGAAMSDDRGLCQVEERMHPIRVSCAAR